MCLFLAGLLEGFDLPDLVKIVKIHGQKDRETLTLDRCGSKRCERGTEERGVGAERFEGKRARV